MTQALKTLLALLKKNNTQPGVLTAVWVVVAMAAFAVIDAKRLLSPPAWLGMAAWVLILGASAGAGAFSVDLKSNHLRFLEYLPIRRWHIWLSDWGDGLLWLGVMLLALTVPRTVAWAPPGGGGSPADAFEQVFFSRRWSLLAGLLCLAFCSFSIGAFYRVLIERDTAMMLRSLMSSLAVCTAVWVAPAMLGIVPTLLEASVPLFVLGALFSAGSFVVFVLDPKHWGAVRRWLLLRMPCLAAIHLLAAAVVLLSCRRWAVLDLSGPARVEAVTVTGGPADALLVRVRSLRSGPHLLSLDPRTGQQRYLGRGLTMDPRGGPATAGSAITADGRVLLRADFAADGLWPTPGAVVSVGVDGGGRRSLFNVRQVAARDGGGEHSVGEVAWSPDGTSLVFATRAGRDSDAHLCIADASGVVRHRVPVAHPARFAMRRDHLIAVPKPRPDGTEGQAPVRSLLRVDLRSGGQRTIELPGTLVVCSADLTAALCLQRDDRDGARRRSLAWVDLLTNSSAPVAGEQEIPSVPLGEAPPREYGSADWVPLIGPSAGGGGTVYVGDVHVNLDDTGRRVAWFVSPRDQTPVAPQVTIVDVPRGEKRRLTITPPATPPPTSQQAGSRRPFVAHGFTRGGDEWVYEWGGEVVAVAPDGRRRVMARRPDGPDHVEWQLSPDRRRVAATVFQDNRSGGVPSARQTVQVWRDGVPLTVYGSESARVQWLDTDQLVVHDNSTIMLIEAGGGGRRRLFAIGTENDRAAGTGSK